MKEVKGEVYIHFLELPKDFSFSLDKNLRMELESFREENAISILNIKGNLNSEIENPEEYLQRRIKFFLDLINFSKGTSPNEFFINSEIKEEGKTDVTRTVGIYTSGKLKLQKDELKLIQKNQLKKFSEVHLLCLNFYKKACDTKDIYAKYWYLYTIASVLLGDRKEINDYFMINFNSQKTYSDWKNDECEISNFIFARDLFSHLDKTSHKIKVNKDDFLKDHMLIFVEETKKLMLDKISNL